MIKTTVGNSMSRVQGLSKEQFRALREVLSYRVDAQGSHFSGYWKNPKRHLLSARGDFPSGLIPLVLENIKKLPHEIIDLRVKPRTNPGAFVLSPSVAPRSYQRRAVATLVLSERGGAEMVTGSGKSMTMALLMESLQLKTLVVVPNLELKRQLTQVFQEVFLDPSNVVVENIDSPRLKTYKDFDVLIIDECHHAAARTYRRLNTTAWKGVYHRYFFSGTFFRGKTEEQMLLNSIVGECTYKFGYREAVAAGAIVPVEAYYVELPKQEIQGSPTSWPSVYSELVTNNKARNDLIQRLILNLHLMGKSALCLVKEIKHGEQLSSKGAFLFANGQDGGSSAVIKKFLNSSVNCIVGTVGVLGEGVDTKPCEYIIIAGLGKSKPAFMQQVGRGVRRYGNKASCKVIIFRDPSHRWTREHFRAQVRYLRDEYGIVPIKLSLS